MKQIHSLIIAFGFATIVATHAQTNAVPTPPQPPAAPAAPPDAPPPPVPVKPEIAPAQPAEVAPTNALSIRVSVIQSLPAQPAEVAPTNAVVPFDPANPDALLHMNFRGAPLDMVLSYLSEAAGFIINLEATPRGRVDVWSSTPVSRDEAIDLLNSVLRKNGYAAIRNGRTLTIVNKDEAKIHDIPVKLGSDPDNIPRNDETVTQIIPVRFVEVAQLLKDLQPLVSVQTTMTANEAGNSIIITDTQANIHRVAEIIKAIDTGAEDGTEVRVFRLQYADPTEMSDLLVNLFPDDSRSGGSSSAPQFGGFGGGMRRFFGGGQGGMGQNSGGGSQNTRIKKRAKVVAVPDPRTSSVVVSAAKDLISQIEGVVNELDSNPAHKQNVKVIQLQNADAQEVQQVLGEIFQKSGTSNNRSGNRSGNSQNSTLQNRSTTQQNSTGNNSGRSGSGGGRSGLGLGQ